MNDSNIKDQDTIYIIHSDWEGICYLKNDKIYRKNFDDEYGFYTINYNRLTINWNKWPPEDFFNININSIIYYSKNIYDTIYIQYLIIEKNIDKLIIYNKNSKLFNIWNKGFINNNDTNKINFSSNIDDLNEKKNIFLFKNIEYSNYIYIKYDDYSTGSLDIDDNYIILYFKNDINDIKKYKNINNSIYYGEIKIINNFIACIDIKEIYPNKYIFNKSSFKFYNINNLYDIGFFKIITDTIYMNWTNKSDIYDEKSIQIKKINNINYINQYNLYNDIKIISPNKIILNNRILFSNISLCKKKIILSSIHYKYNNWDLNNLHINIKNSKILKKTIYDNDDYETSTTIILDLDKEVERETIYITFMENKYKIYLEQLKIINSDITAMTLFKSDYELLKRYLKYYSELGVENFFLYYNSKIDTNIIEKIKALNIYNYKIYLIEWNYLYWWFYDKNEKHHYSQTMAINDSLNILKNYTKYILYNDLDEYFILDKYKTFNQLINDNDEVDIFIFKNHFCSMGNNLIKYKNFDKVFDLSNITKGNYWDKYREKNFIKCKNINVMGVHGYFPKFNELCEIKEKNISYFLHILNFYEKNRLNLMTEYTR
jgi:hypothetical protein